MSISSADSSRPNATFALVARALRARPLLKFFDRQAGNARTVDDDPWNEPGGMSDEMERAFIAREMRRR